MAVGNRLLIATWLREGVTRSRPAFFPTCAQVFKRTLVAFQRNQVATTFHPFHAAVVKAYPGRALA
jgi:hypothetical protein